MKTLTIAFLILIIPILGFAVNVSGYALDDTTNNGVSGLLIYMHRTSPNSWENVYFTDTTDDNGNFDIEGVTPGVYRIYTDTIDGYFAGYFESYVTIADSDVDFINIPISPVITEIDSEFSHSSLDYAYVVVDEVIVDTGWDEQIDYGETISFSLRLKNIGGQYAYNNNFTIYSNYSDIIMDPVDEAIASLAPEAELVFGPYEFTVGNEIVNEYEFSLFYSFYSDQTVNHYDIPFIAYAPDVFIDEYIINSNGGEISDDSINNIRLDIGNQGGAVIQYPMLSITSNDEQVVLDDSFEITYYYLGLQDDGFGLDYYFDFSIDPDAYNDNQLDFILVLTTLGGEYEDTIEFSLAYTPSTGIEDEIPVSQIGLLGNHPNPFNPETTISFNLDNPNGATIDIYNVLGKRIKHFEHNEFASKSGSYSVTWNGKDELNRDVPSGFYFYKLNHGSYTHTKKMVLLK